MAENIIPRLPDSRQKSDSTNRIFWLVLLAVGAIAIGSFALSYAALHALAITNGIPPVLAPIWPLIVDVSVVVFTAAILVSQLQRRGTKLAIALTGFYSIVTIAGNLLHAPGNWLGWFVAALPPLSLVFATEMLRAMAHHSILRHSAIVTLAELDSAVATTRAELDSLVRRLDSYRNQLTSATAELEALKSAKIDAITPKTDTNIDNLNAAKQEAKQERVNTLLSFLADNPQASLTEAAPIVGVSRQTISTYVGELTTAGVINKNGNGWEVSR